MRDEKYKIYFRYIVKNTAPFYYSTAVVQLTDSRRATILCHTNLQSDTYKNITESRAKFYSVRQNECPDGHLEMFYPGFLLICKP
jgi:hypothetical protein